MVERREFAQVVDDARPDGDGDGPRAVEHLVDPLHIGPVGMKLLLFNKETLAGNSRLAHGCVDGFAGGFPYRSAGLSCSALTPDDAPVQLDFLGDEARRIKTERLESAIDGLRRRFGHQIVRRAVVLADGQYAQLNPREEHTVHPVPFYAG